MHCVDVVEGETFFACMNGFHVGIHVQAAPAEGGFWSWLFASSVTRSSAQGNYSAKSLAGNVT